MSNENHSGQQTAFLWACVLAAILLMAIFAPKVCAAETWKWDAASGGVSGYQVEDSLGVTRATPTNSITIEPASTMRKIRARATDGTAFGAWSDWSYRAGYNPDCDGDGYVFPSDFADCFLPAIKEGVWRQ